MSVSARSTVPRRRLNGMPLRFSPECFVDSTPGEIVEFVVRCNVATSSFAHTAWAQFIHNTNTQLLNTSPSFSSPLQRPLCRRPTHHQHLLRHHLLQPSPPCLVIVLGDVLTRRCAPAGITEGVDEKLVIRRRASSPKSFLPIGGVIAVKIDVDDERSLLRPRLVFTWRRRPTTWPTTP